ncbi:xanthine dehydrogenase family protein molybdopterin-binding subunit [Bradyrhizobium sp. URHD0069]|uniref:xanthine dehydrogenase family protein molybdopterin-binding subunit n=1 Tax=Bradyrhizobium sp. URHD0069 TaxID=1380355 RepID=UPI0004972718|nr:xanthine dehydrogenase family protein molybdopterin-binding subunit [Bradyrhizobium sp. URHD0069]
MIGNPVLRVDGRAKVTGAARYAADFNQKNQLYAVIVGATVGLGRVTAIDVASVSRMPGVVAVISHLNAPKLAYGTHKGSIDPAVGERLHVLQDNQVRFFGQPIAVVVAESLDIAERAAAELKVSYSRQQPVIDPKDPKAQQVTPDPRGRVHADRSRGNADAAVASAPVKIDERYDTARENHNPMEPHATIAAWNGNRLTLWSKSQFVVNEQAEIAAIFGIPVQQVQVVCPFIGGAFGTSLRTWPHVTLAAIAARHVGRPVKLVLSRKQMFFTTGHRPRTLQRVALGATSDGKLVSLIQEANGETSRYEQFVEAVTSATNYMVSCPNVSTRYRLSPLDTSTPTYMRGPGEATNMFALECALDELSYKLGIDPIELRRRNEPTVDEETQKPFSSRSLMHCYTEGAERFGWARRDPKPRSMRDGRLLIGYGVASATYPVFYAPANALARLLPSGIVEVEAAASDMGPGTYTSMTQVAAETLGLPMDQVRFRLGYSVYPATPPHGGSMTMASVGSAVRAACIELRRLAEGAAVAAPQSPVFKASVEQLEWKQDRVYRRENAGSGISYREIGNRAGKPIEAQGSSDHDPELPKRYSMHAFGAAFIEVAVDPDVGTIRVRRTVGVYGAGRIINPFLARSQCIGGIVGGIGMALMESTALDPRDGRIVNAHMADYVVPVNLDISNIDVSFVEENDPHVNPLGVKGLGEIAIVGIAPAIANAVYHATGKRIRTLPIRIENMLSH